MLLEFSNPIPIKTPIGDAYAIYVKSNGMMENDEWCCAMMEDGQVRHFTTDQIKVWHNETYGIKKKNDGDKKQSRASPIDEAFESAVGGS